MLVIIVLISIFVMDKWVREKVVAIIENSCQFGGFSLFLVRGRDKTKKKVFNKFKGKK